VADGDEGLGGPTAALRSNHTAASGCQPHEIGKQMTRASLRKATAALAAASLLALAAGCGDSGDDDTSSGTSDGDGISGKRIVLIAGSNTNPWAGHFNEVFTAAVEKEGGEVDQQLTLDSAEQVQLFNQALSSHPDLIATELLDTSAMVASLKKAAQMDVPVVVFDGPPDPSVLDDVMTVTSNDEQLGEIAAQNLVEGMEAAGMDSGGFVIMSGSLSMILTNNRLDGFHKYMEDYPQYEELEIADTGWDPEKATEQVTQLFAKYGDELNAVYGMADYLALPAIQAGEQAGRTPNEDLVVVGGNCFKAGIDAIKAGTYFATGTQDPGTVAERTAEYVSAYFAGDDPDQHTTIDWDRVTKETVDQFAEQCSHA
jgi:ABC-type sugar transport system substrate-binding protein